LKPIEKNIRMFPTYYQVRITRDKHPYRLKFKFTEDTQEDALNKARNFVAEYRDTLKNGNGVFNRKLHTNNTSGTPGICRQTKSKSGNPFWEAFWYEGKKLCRKSFSVYKYGEREAWRLAVETRLEAARRLYR
jgi:hypothetical protein